MTILRLLGLTAAGLAGSALAIPPVDPRGTPPTIEARPVTEDYFGTQVTDRFRFMESRDAQTIDWMKAQGRYARSVFDAIAPRADYLQRMSAFGSQFGVSNSTRPAGKRIFYLSRPPGSDVFKLFVREGTSTRLLVDTEALMRAQGGKPQAIDWVAPSLDGDKVALGISSGGSENSVMTVISTASGRTIAGPIDRAQAGGVSWLDDGSGLFFTRLQKLKPEDEAGAARYKNLTTDYWDLKHETVPETGPGTGKGPVRSEDAWPDITKVPHRGDVLLSANNGVQPEASLWWSDVGSVRAGRQAWRPLATPDDAVTNFAANRTTLYLMSHHEAPTFKVLSVPIGGALSKAKVVVPVRPDRLIENIAAASDGLYVAAREKLWSKLLHVGPSGAVTEIPLPYQASIGEIVSDPERPGVVISVESWTRPESHLRYDPATRRFADLGLDTQPSIDAARYATVELEATARDGTQVPLSVMVPAGPVTARPLLLNAYGAYGISDFPYFTSRHLVFIDAGASWASCHVRGGGELGEAWRLGGKGPTKPNTWGDFAACAETLIAKGYTTADMLTVTGTSAGGVAVGRVATDRPELFAGAVARVGDVNSLRAEFMPAGPANIPEFGTVTKESGFKDLYEMDTIQHVREGVRYPAFLITGGLNDPRVEPWEGAKLAARLQEIPGNRPTLFRIEEEAGHGLGTTKSTRDAEEADIAAFVFWRAGVPAWQPKMP